MSDSLQIQVEGERQQENYLGPHASNPMRVKYSRDR